MAPTIKQPIKPAFATSTMSSASLAQRTISHQNLAVVDTTNPVKQVDSASDNSGKIDQYYCHGFQYWKTLDITLVEQNDISTTNKFIVIAGQLVNY